MSTSVSITMLYGGLCTLLLVSLGGMVSAARGKHKVYIGDTPPPELQRQIRAHGNAAEYIPIGILMLALLELSGGVSSLWLHVLGGAFLLGRVLHVAGVLMKSPIATAGAAINYSTLGALGIWNIAQHFMGPGK